MTTERTCPVCGGATRAGADWNSFWTGTTVCKGCSTSLRLWRGWKAYVVHNVLLFAVAAVAYLITRGMPGLWALVAFLALFIPIGTVLVALVQWLRWRHAEMTPLGE